ncbi:MAG TPA: hypothetical protein VHX36_08790 [Candidatus Acidoferrales bacterium]|jgi:hypothetical protein|nr:hypothetical protein [Candidatus Acidoferrales bacterium]
MDRRKMLALLGVSPALVVDSPAYGGSAPKAISGHSHGNDGDGDRITVMNPGIANKLATRVPLVPPLDTLQNKLIYMINLSWEGPDAANYFYGAMTEWLQTHYRGVKTVVKVTADGMFGLDPSILKEITANKADAVIVGVAG